MAEIPIEKKERSNLLPLLLGALLLLALLGWCFTRDRDVEPAPGAADTTAVMTPGDTTLTGAGAAAGGAAAAAGGAAGGAAAGAAVGAGGNAMNDFVTYVSTRDTSMETEANHQYTAGGVRRLAAALEGIAGSNPNIQVYADSMRSSVDRLQRSSGTDVHADDAKAAFSAAVSAMEQIDRARGRTRDVAPMRAIYNQLNSRQPLLPQLPTVQRFFEAARDGLQAMGAAA